jgi:xanthine dehydrogenase/oxidase
MHGSQCGFCTPGFVMALYALIRNNATPSEHEIEECFEGCLCRCTGYRPILDAARTFITTAPPEEPKKKPLGCGRTDCCQLKNGTATEEKPVKTFPLPDLKPYDATTELIFPPALRKYEMKPLFFGNKRKRWLRPMTVEQLVDIKSAYPSAKITGGSSEIQIEIRFKALQYALSVYTGEIEELKRCEMKADSVEIGANITLSQMQEFLASAEKHYGEEKAQTCTALLHQLRYFAGPQVRNVATPAGNIATASPISDLNPVFVATGTTLYAQTKDGEISIPMREFFKGYRTTALPPSAVITRLSIPLTGQGEYIRAYKQAKRKDDDIAIVNAAIKMRLSDTKVIEDISLAYGGMGPTTVQAKKTIEYLQGKQFGDPQVLEGAFNALEQDFNLAYNVPGGMPVYRKTLALGFFFRFWHDIGGELKIDASQKFDDAVYEIEREISKGHRDADNPQYSYILTNLTIVNKKSLENRSTILLR